MTVRLTEFVAFVFSATPFPVAGRQNAQHENRAGFPTHQGGWRVGSRGFNIDFPLAGTPPPQPTPHIPTNMAIVVQTPCGWHIPVTYWTFKIPQAGLWWHAHFLQKKNNHYVTCPLVMLAYTCTRKKVISVTEFTCCKKTRNVKCR